MSVHGYRLWRQLPNANVELCAKLAIEASDSGLIRNVQFQYTGESSQQALDPVNFPYQQQTFQLAPNSRDLPGLIDDLIPDGWGRAVISRFYALQGVHFRPSDTISILNHLPSSNVGALKLERVAADSGSKPVVPDFSLGTELEQLRTLAQPEYRIDRTPPENLQGMGLHLLLGGSSVGGARPKVLAFENQDAYIVKFPKQDDPFDIVAVEHACMKLAEAAGAEVARTEVGKMGSLKFLKVKRFDLTRDGGRFHMITANAMLKDSSTFEDVYHGSYNQLARLVIKYCVNPEKHLKQLFRQMLINEMINNRDDHLRNFTFLLTDQGWELSPAYDLVPSIEIGAYPQLMFNNNVHLPNLTDAVKAAGSFNLTRGEASEIVEQVRDAMNTWQETFKELGVSEKDRELLKKVFAQ